MTTRQAPLCGPTVVRLLPYGTVLAAAIVPLATGLYLATTTLWTVVERRYLVAGLVNIRLVAFIAHSVDGERQNALSGFLETTVKRVI